MFSISSVRACLTGLSLYPMSFLRSDNTEIQKQLGIKIGNPIEAFAKLRDLKDNF